MDETGAVINIRRGRASDAGAVGAVHVAAWRSTYPGILPDEYLANLSVVRHSAGYERGMVERRNGHALFVATAAGADLVPRPAGLVQGSGMAPGAPQGASQGASRGASAGGGQGASSGASVIGFVSGGRCRRPYLADGEIETLYLLDDFRERGVGRRLMRAMAAHLAAIGCRSVLVWVLRDNPSRWFYGRLGGRIVAQERIDFAGAKLDQLALVWEPIESLLAATAPVQDR